ncbi:outer membrane protein TolC [Sphaerotilus hippei]|uniref:Outer membrane protein TolC n=1 Tax=Sphaerotilus hippei TaxID=744406 RepID=A0A318H1P9_9BURK|nr:TolC family protein [Sphaerotilus hippei]PXW96958.1 outer membrane protein TolC [Sphaerotilus hippei]
MRSTPLLLGLIAAATLAGCASTSPDAAIEPVQQRLQQHTGAALSRWPDAQAPSPEARQRLRTLLAAPLTMEAAVEVTLLNHRGLQASLADLGVTQAELAQVTRLPNLGFSFSRTNSGDEIEWERGLHFGLGRLLLMPLAKSLENQRLAAQQAQTTLQVIEHLATARRAWVEAVAAEEGLRYLRQVHEAAEAGAELARRMALAGNFNRLALAREQAFEAEAVLAVARGERARDAARERMNRALGLWGEQLDVALPERLPDLPAQPLEQPDIEARALAQRLDVQAAKVATGQTARSLGLTRTTRFVNVLELGLTRANTSDSHRSRAWEVSLELPLFDWGDARVARSQAVYTASLHRTASIAIDARSEVREAYRNWHHAWEIARHVQAGIVPLKQRISGENLLRYNGMLIGVFELLADARSQITSVSGAIDARRDFWLADADLQMAMLGRPALAGGSAPSPSSAAADSGAGH